MLKGCLGEVHAYLVVVFLILLLRHDIFLFLGLCIRHLDDCDVQSLAKVKRERRRKGNWRRRRLIR